MVSSPTRYGATLLKVLALLIALLVFPALRVAAAQHAVAYAYQVILVPTRDDAERLRQSLRNGASFTQLARQYSVGPNIAQGGRLGNLSPKALAPGLRLVAQNLAPGSVSQPVETPLGFLLLRKSSDAELKRGVAAFEAREFRKALTFFEADLQLNPDRDLSRLYSARAYEALGEMHAAMSVYLDMLRRGGEDAMLLDRLGGLSYKAGDTEQAIDYYKRSIITNPDYAAVFNNLAWLYAQENMELEQAAGLMRHAISLEPTQPAYFDTLATIAMRLKRHDRALAAINAAVFYSGNEAFYLEQRQKIVARRQSAARVQPLSASEHQRPAPPATAADQALATPSPQAAPAAPPTTARQSITFFSPGAKGRAKKDRAAKEKPERLLRIKVLNGGRTQVAARQAIARLTKAGYVVERFDQHERHDWKRSAVYYKPAFRSAAAGVAAHLGDAPRLRPLSWPSIFDLIIVVANQPKQPE